jgi:dienelactone hydrolase
MSESEDITLEGRSAYLATPIATDRHSGPWPGVVVVHDAFGITDDMREQADWLAAAGYLAVVPDLYAGKAAVRCVRSMFAQLTAKQGPAFDQIASVRSWLAGSADTRPGRRRLRVVVDLRVGPYSVLPVWCSVGRR